MPTTDALKSARRTDWFAIIGLACPAGLLALIGLMRFGAFTFHDDFLGYKGLGFFLFWALALLLTGLLCSSASLLLRRHPALSLAGLLLNAGLLLLGLYNL